MSQEVVIFFIGGAGDAKPYFGMGPTYIVRDQIQRPFGRIAAQQAYSSHYLGYDDVYGVNNIKKNVLALIPDNARIHIVGHSFGGWNAAHLSQILSDQTCDVGLLITLDPVGTRRSARFASSIYRGTPQPQCRHWINIDSKPERWKVDDFVAWGGGQWIPPHGKPEVFHESKAHHREAGRLFRDVMDGGFSASDLLLEFIQGG